MSDLNKAMNTLGSKTARKSYAVHFVTESHHVPLSLLVRLAPHCLLSSHSPHADATQGIQQGKAT